MKDQKRVFKYFTIMEYELEQEYLRKKHQEGWRFDHVTIPGIYTFVKCEPEDVVYQLDYNQDRKKDMAGYVQMYRDCGWEYLCDFMDYSYFRKPVAVMQGEEEIFNDDASKLDMLERVYKGRMVPLLVIFFAVICPQIIMQGRGIYGTAEYIFFGVYCVLFALYVYIFVRCGVVYKKLSGRKK
jgi:hypothetical protein